jgi:DNA processing protein
VLEELGMQVRPATNAEAGADDGFLVNMGFDACDIDELAGRSGLPAEAVSAMLLKLELDGKIASLPGGLYQRIR